MSLGHTGATLVVPYRSYGTLDRLFVMGRVLENTSAATAGDDDSIWQNLLNTYRRLETDEVPGALIRAQFGDVVAETVTDEEGHFRLWLEGVSKYTRSGWMGVEVSVCEPGGDRATSEPATAEVQVPGEQAQFGVISDIDDTVMKSHATELLRMA